MEKSIIEFIRKKDFIYVKELCQGACGRTVLLHDDIIEEQFVCKKYQPLYEEDRKLLFKNFVQEIKLLHLVYHLNVVRVFGYYYIYPEQYTGYILMEFIDGSILKNICVNTPKTLMKFSYKLLMDLNI